MAFIKEIANYINSNCDLSKPLTIIFPNKRAALKLRMELMNGDYKKNIWLPQMLSIQEAMCSWSGLQLLDNIDIIFELIKIIGNIDSNDVYGLASQMVKDFDEIDQYAIDAKDLFQNIKDAKEIDMVFLNEDYKIDKEYIRFFENLNKHYTSLREELLKNKTGYYGLISRYIYELDQDKLNEAIGDKEIIFAGFNAMTKTEEGIIVRLIQNNKATLLWDLDEYYFNDKKQEAGIFAREFFERNKNIIPIEPKFLSKELVEGKKKIDVIGASGAVIQTNALQLELHNETKNDNYGTDEAIVLADEALLIPVLNSIPESFSKMQVTMGFPYSKTTLHQFLQQLFSLQNHIKSNNKGIYFWPLTRLLNSELVKTTFSKEELKHLSNWEKELINKSTYYINTDDYKKLEEYKDLYTFLDIISKKWNNTSDCISSIKNLLRTIYDKIDIQGSTYFIGNQISIAGRIINKIERLVNKYDQIIQIHHIEMLYRQSSSEMTINMKGAHDGLQIMGLLETRNLDFKTVHILSVNEGILPQSKSANSMIPFFLRKNYGLPLYTNKQAVYAYHFYRLLQHAENIKIYYNTLADGMGEGESSRFIKQIIHEMPNKNHNVEICEKIYKSPTSNNLEIKKIQVKKTDEIYDKIVKKLSYISPENKISGLAPTSISCYLKCPLKFYLEYIEKVKDESPNELIQSNVIGTIIHATFENLYRHFEDKEITLEIYQKVLKEHFDESLQKALSDNNFPNGLPNTGFNYLNSKMMDKMIENFINHEIAFFEDGEKTMKIIGLEQKLHQTIEISENIKVNLIGNADRIDQVGNKIRIIDYKTGAIKNEDVLIKKTFKELKDLNEKALQLLIYKYLYKKSNENSEYVIEPGIFGLRKLSKGLFQLSNSSDYFKEDTLIEDCESMFLDLFKEILNKEIPFKQTEIKNNCKYCDFLELCKKEPNHF